MSFLAKLELWKSGRIKELRKQANYMITSELETNVRLGTWLSYILLARHDIIVCYVYTCHDVEKKVISKYRA